MTWGAQEERLLKVEEQTGQTPHVLLTKPKLWPWLQWYYEAFWMIDPGRIVHQGSVGHIPLTEYWAYMSIFDINGLAERQFFIHVMRSLDAVYVRKINAEINRKSDHAKVQR